MNEHDQQCEAHVNMLGHCYCQHRKEHKDTDLLKHHLAVAVEALRKIADRWFDPAEGGCCMECEANLPSGNPHDPSYCPFDIAHTALEQIGDK